AASFTALVVSADGRILCGGAPDGSLLIWDLDKDTDAPLIQIEKAHQHHTLDGRVETLPITDIMCSPKGEVVVTRDRRSIRIWKRAHSGLLSSPLWHIGDTNVVLSNNARWLATSNGEILAFDLAGEYPGKTGLILKSKDIQAFRKSDVAA